MPLESFSILGLPPHSFSHFELFFKPHSSYSGQFYLEPLLSVSSKAGPSSKARTEFKSGTSVDLVQDPALWFQQAFQQPRLSLNVP